MTSWFVIHGVQSFLDHPEWIGRRGYKLPIEFARMRRSDGVLYYCKGDVSIAGAFKVASRAKQISGDAKWRGPYTIVELDPVALPDATFRKPDFIPLEQLLTELPKPLSLFPDRHPRGVTLRGKTVLPLTPSDFRMAVAYIRKWKRTERALFSGASNDAGLGEPGNYEVMRFAPTSEQGVVAMFVHHMKRLGFDHLEFIRSGFPDACAIRHDGKSYERKYIEFEFLASGFRQHVKSAANRTIRCDYVVCWEDDYPTCPVPVISLRNKLDEPTES